MPPNHPTPSTPPSPPRYRYSPSLSEQAPPPNQPALAPRTRRHRRSRRHREAHIRAKTISWRQRRPDREAAFAHQPRPTQHAPHPRYIFPTPPSYFISPSDSSPSPPPRQPRARLASLRPPSAVVPFWKKPSPLAALSEQDRQTHHRRTVASCLRFEWLTPEGNIQPALPHYLLRNAGLDRYHVNLAPPPEDANPTNPPRARKHALSHTYRGNGLRRIRTGVPRPRRSARARLRRSTADADISPTTDSGNEAYFGDLDAWCPSDEYAAAVASRTAARAALLSPEDGEITDQIEDNPPTQPQLSSQPHHEQVGQEQQQKQQQEKEKEKEKEKNNPLAALFADAKVNFSLSIDEPPKRNPSPPKEHRDIDEPKADTNFADFALPTQNLELCHSPGRRSKGKRLRNNISGGNEARDTQRPRYSGMGNTRGDQGNAHRGTNVSGALDDSDEIEAREKHRGGSPDKQRHQVGWSLMRKSGYTDGKLGLGRLEDGITAPIPCSRQSRTARELKTGIGVGTASDGQTAAQETTDHNGTASRAEALREDGAGIGTGANDSHHRETRTGRDSTARPQNRGAQADPDGAVAPPDEKIEVESEPKTANVPSNTVLDLEDDLETEDEDAAKRIVDNGRRAIMMDFDLLVRNCRERRVRAFTILVRSAEFRAARGEETGEVDVRRTLFGAARDVIDADMIAGLLGSVGKDVLEKMMEILDAGFASGPAAEPNVELVNGLWRGATHGRAEYCFFHRGSRRRFAREAKSMGIARVFVRSLLLDWAMDDYWPYTVSWQDGRLKCGAPPCQTVLLLHDGGEGLIGGVVTGAEMGARTIVATRVGEVAQEAAVAVDKVLQNQHAVVGYKALSRDISSVLAEALRRPAKVGRRRRVLAMYDEDKQWYAARVVFDAPAARGEKKAYSLVEFIAYGNSEWVQRDALLPLPRRLFRIMRSANFPSLVDPGDAAYAVELQP